MTLSTFVPDRLNEHLSLFVDNITISATGFSPRIISLCALPKRNREAIFHFIDHAIEDNHLLGVCSHLENGRIEIVRPCAPDPMRAVGLRELDEIPEVLRNSSPNSVRHAEACHCRTMPIYSLLRMKILTGRRYCTAVDISCMFMRIEASPAISTTRALGWAICTPIAAGEAIAHSAKPARRHPRFGSSKR